jgi:hypothetical protein
MTDSLQHLVATTTEAEYLAQGLAKADAAGCVTTSWRTGDPTLSLYHFLSEALANKDERIAEYVRGGILSLAIGEWLTIHAREVYGVEQEAATYATPSVSIRNTKGAYYSIDSGDMTFRSSVTGKTYHNTSGPHTLNGVGATATLALTADEPGADSSVGVNEVDEIVTTYLGIVIDSSTASSGTDEQDPEALKAQCLATLGALSPNGPSDAYDYVVCNSALTGSTEITRSRAYGDSDTGDVIVYVAKGSGVVSGGALAKALAAVEQWATPLCVTPTVVGATLVALPVNATVTGDNLPSDYADVGTALVSAMIQATRVSGFLARSAIIAVLHKLAVDGGATDVAVTLSSPAADVTLDAGRVLVPGLVTIA